ncbi:MAG: hypothetical protein ACM3ZC_04520, partial [Bacteroidota bacterium]
SDPSLDAIMADGRLRAYRTQEAKQKKVREFAEKYEYSDPHTGERRAIIDLAWPNGLQEGLTPKSLPIWRIGPVKSASLSRAICADTARLSYGMPGFGSSMRY